MIPKIIHYVWLGNVPMPSLMQECIDSWKRYMPDYEYMLWDDDAVQEINNLFMSEALKERKWAFASDVIRVYALYRYGGIYMDTDVMVYRSFDSLLNNHAFIGRENSIHIKGKSTVNHLTSCCFGAEKGNFFIARCWHYYNNRHFITSNDKSLPMELRLDIRTNSSIYCALAAQEGYNPSALANTLQHCKDDVLTIYPKHCFDAVKLQQDTYCKHFALGTWRESKSHIYQYTIGYKIKWRIRFVVEWLLHQFGYIMIKLR